MSRYKLVLVFWDFYPQSTINQIYKTLSYFKKLVPQNSKLMILDLTGFSLKKINNNYIHSDKEIEYFKPQNITDLRKIKKKFKDYEKIYALGPVYSDLKSVFIFLILKWLNLKIIFINYYGYYLKEKNIFKFSFLYKINRFFLFRFSYYLSRILSQISVFPKIEYYFETSQERIDQMNNTYYRRISNKKNFFNVVNEKKIFRINSIYYDNLLEKNIIKKNYDCIVIVDSGFDHPDRYIREKVKDQKNHDLKRKLYFQNLFKFLKFLEISFNKKIVFCQHPKTNYSSNQYFDMIEKNFETIKGKTDELIERGDLIVFTGASSMVNKAIILKKKILYALSSSIGSNTTDLVYSIIDIINLPIINLDKIQLINKESVNTKISESMKLYDEFISKNLVFDKKKSSFEQIKHVLYEN